MLNSSARCRPWWLHRLAEARGGGSDVLINGTTSPLVWPLSVPALPQQVRESRLDEGHCREPCCSRPEINRVGSHLGERSRIDPPAHLHHGPKRPIATTVLLLDDEVVLKRCLKCSDWILVASCPASKLVGNRDDALEVRSRGSGAGGFEHVLQPIIIDLVHPVTVPTVCDTGGGDSTTTWRWTRRWCTSAKASIRTGRRTHGRLGHRLDVAVSPVASRLLTHGCGCKGTAEVVAEIEPQRGRHGNRRILRE